MSTGSSQAPSPTRYYQTPLSIGDVSAVFFMSRGHRIEFVQLTAPQVRLP